MTSIRALKEAFEANDLERICHTLDVLAFRYGFASFAQAAKIDRTTLFRTFRRQQDLSLDKMIRIIRVLNARMIVQPKKGSRQVPQNPSSLSTHRAASMLTAAFRSDNLMFLVQSLRWILKAQDNVSEVARNTTSSRTTLYHAFTYPHIPRIKIILGFLDAVGLRISLEPIAKSFGLNDKIINRKKFVLDLKGSKPHKRIRKVKA